MTHTIYPCSFFGTVKSVSSILLLLILASCSAELSPTPVRTQSELSAKRGPPAQPTARTTPTAVFPAIQESFDTDPASWILSGSAVVSNGQLELTPNEAQRLGIAVYDAAIPNTGGLNIRFDYFAGGGSGAEGLSLFLIDGTVSLPTGGGPGSSLGYIYNATTPGQNRGYLGLGFDAAGNYLNSSLYHDGKGPRPFPDHIGLRGSSIIPSSTIAQAEYDYILNSGVDVTPFGGVDGGTRVVNFTLHPDQHVSLQVSWDGGTVWRSLYSNLDFGTLNLSSNFGTPNFVKVGLSGATGVGTNKHSVGAIRIAPPLDLSAKFTSVPNGSPYVDDSITYTAEVSNRGPNAETNALIECTVAAELENVSWSYTSTAGKSGSGSGNLIRLYIALDVDEVLSLVVTGTVAHSALDTVLSNQIKVTEGDSTGDSNLINNSDTSNLQTQPLLRPIPLPFEETFASLPVDWLFSGSASISSGALQLTSAFTNDFGSGIFNRPISSAQGLNVQISYCAEGGTGGNGLSMFLLDGEVPFPKPGSPTGLGYLYDSILPGLTSAYLGLGLDSIGTFSSSSVWHDGDSALLSPNSISLRGSSTLDPSFRIDQEYDYVPNSLVSVASAGQIAGGSRRVNLTILPDERVYLEMSWNGGSTWTPLLTALNFGSFNQSEGYLLPSTFKLGFSAATGTLTNRHCIESIRAAVPVDQSVTNTGQPTSPVNPMAHLSYSFTLQSAGPASDRDAVVTLIASPALTNVTWTLTDPGGAILNGVGSSMSQKLTLEPGSLATLTVDGTLIQGVHNTTVQTQVSLVPGATLGEISQWNNTAIAQTLVKRDLDEDGIADDEDDDDDGDGLPDLTEPSYGTNPELFDTDADGLSDGAEVALGFDPISTDRDSDGVPDLFDEDNDQDGIPDMIECDYLGVSLTNGSFEQPTISGKTFVAESAVPGWETTGSDSQIELWQTSFAGISSGSGPQLAELNASAVGTLYQDFPVVPGMLYLYRFYHRGAEGPDTLQLSFGTPSQTSIVGESTADDTSWRRVLGTVSIPVGQTVSRLALDAVSSSTGLLSQGNLLDGIAVIPGCFTDTDGDLVADAFDLDADSDGILDSVEAGHHATQSNGILSGPYSNNGLSDGVESAPDSSLLDYAVADTDSDGLPDFRDLESDGDGLLDQDEVSLGTNPYDTDTDHDGLSDPVEVDGPTDPLDPDTDDDGFLDGVDAFPTDPLEWVDTDLDGIGNNADLDDDGDGLLDLEEISIGTDPLDPDTDDDGCTDSDDVFPLDSTECRDTDGDGVGDNADEDADNDGFNDDVDNCQIVVNPGQEDLDQDGQGDACDEDLDGDGYDDQEDNCPLIANPDQADPDGDQIGTACELDSDLDGVIDDDDNCVDLANPDQLDLDQDELGDLCDSDIDGDGILNEQDNCPLVANPNQDNTDEDTSGNACDEDRDGDGVDNGVDNCPDEPNPDQLDDDDNGIGDACLTPADPTLPPGSLEGGGCSCSHEQSSIPLSALVLLLLALSRLLTWKNGTRRLTLTGFLILCAFSFQVNAQTLNLYLQNFQPLPGVDERFLHVQGAADALNSIAAFGVGSSFAYRPLVYRKETGEVVELIRYQLVTDLQGAARQGKHFQLGLAVPFVAFQEGGGAALLGADSLSSQALGDVRLIPRFAFSVPGLSAFNLGLSLPVTFPTGSPEQLSGNGWLTVEPKLLVQVTPSVSTSFGLNLGFLLRSPLETDDFVQGSELTFGAAVSHSLMAQKVTLGAEVFGKLVEGELALAPGSIPVEVLLFSRLQVAKLHRLTLGAGAGITRGYGAPTARIFLGYSCVLPTAKVRADVDGDGVVDDRDSCIEEPEDLDQFQDDDGCPELDNDNDGIRDSADGCPMDPESLNDVEDQDGCPEPDADADRLPDLVDKCPTNAEDWDQFQDQDGCPDGDNDADGIPDTHDRCPLVPEDLDSLMDTDGCPEPDADGDGILDEKDVCPRKAENLNGVKDGDGCPEPDTDSDGIVDPIDQCPKKAETLNGYRDTDGCPEPDLDSDGIADAVDQCPKRPESFNGHKDEDGCPDVLPNRQKAHPMVKRPNAPSTPNNSVVGRPTLEDQTALPAPHIGWEVRLYFQIGKSILEPESERVLRETAELLKSDARVIKTRIHGHADSRGGPKFNRRLSRQRLQTVMDFLHHQGVDLSKVEAAAFGEWRPVATNNNPQGRSENRRVELRIYTREDVINSGKVIDPKQE